MDDARKNGRIEYEVEILAGLGKLFFETGRPEEAKSYYASSNALAMDNNLNNILLENYIALSRMEHSLGGYKKAMEYLSKYNSLRDSLFSADKLANISQLQRVGEVLKAKRKIDSLAVEQRIRERTISYQQVIMFIAFAVLLSVVAVLLFVFKQKNKLNKAYRVLFEKNLKIMELQEGPSRKQPKMAPHYDDDGELLCKILAIMEDTEAICNPKFSINVLSSLAEANHIYVSQVINTTLRKNFRSFLNEYRIREAQRLFSEADAARYTIESVSLQLGYRSQNTFRAAFQEITGVTPSFYLKSIHETPRD
jgi:AraC-like DNA-binding protein